MKNKNASKAIQTTPLIGLLAMMLCASAGAEPLSLDPEAEPATLVEFKAEPKLGDFVGRAEGTVDGSGKRFYLKGLNVMAPTVIQLMAKDPAKPIEVSLHRFMWREANQQGQTDERGDWSFVGRIHDEVGIELKAEEPSEFYVLAWRGPEQQTLFGENLFVPMDSGSSSTSDDSGQAGSVPWLAIVAVIAAAAVAIAFMLLKFRSNRSGAVMIGSLAVTTFLVAGEVRADPANANFGPRLAAAESGLEYVWEALGENTRTVAEELHTLRSDRDFVISTVGEMQTILARRLHEHDVAIQETSEGLTSLAELTVERFEGVESDIANLYMLLEQDRAAIPDPTFGDVAPMPSNCYDNPACADCFDAANEKLVARMAQYEKLRSIYSTNRSMVEYVVMTGDALSGFHQLEQAAWYGIKLDIRQAQMNVTRAYNAKFAEFNQKLDLILREFGQCEAQHGSDDWYLRHGKLFYNSLINSYRVHDDTELPF